MTDIQKLVEDCARIFCCGNTCASLHDSRPCCAADHHVRTCAVIRHTLEFAAREGVHNQSKGGDANAGAARDANKPIPDTSPGVTAGAIEAATRIRNLFAQLSEARREGDLYRRAYGCLSCGEKVRDCRFELGQHVRKKSGSSWQGRIVGFYSTTLTPIGYAVESEREPGSVQIYPESALEALEAPHD